MNSAIMLKIAQGVCVVGSVLGAIGSVIFMHDKYAAVDSTLSATDDIKEDEFEATEFIDEDDED